MKKIRLLILLHLMESKSKSRGYRSNINKNLYTDKALLFKNLDVITSITLTEIKITI